VVCTVNLKVTHLQVGLGAYVFDGHQDRLHTSLVSNFTMLVACSLVGAFSNPTSGDDPVYLYEPLCTFSDETASAARCVVLRCNEVQIVANISRSSWLQGVPVVIAWCSGE
jgi:hypothetical protein